MDGPESIEEHDSYDWGKATLEALKSWKPEEVVSIFNWKAKPDGSEAKSGLVAS